MMIVNTAKTKEQAEKIINDKQPLGCFIYTANEGLTYTGIFNLEGKAETYEHKSIHRVIAWLNYREREML